MRDGNTDRLSALTRYYTETGTPPGTWIGSGVAEFGSREPEAGIAPSSGGADPLPAPAEALTEASAGLFAERFHTSGSRRLSRLSGNQRAAGVPCTSGRELERTRSWDKNAISVPASTITGWPRS